MLAPESFITRNTAMPIVIATIPISVFVVLANIVPIFIPGPFDQRAAVNRDPDVVVCSAAKRPAAFPGAVPSDIEVVACQNWSHKDGCGCKSVELHREGGGPVDESWWRFFLA